eukprot:jgi/Galph1/5819/GphlegSOOS_G4417.1
MTGQMKSGGVQTMEHNEVRKAQNVSPTTIQQLPKEKVCGKFDKNEKVAENYYDDMDADTFYYYIWGGQDIHVGLYKEPVEKDIIRDASRRTVYYMSDLLKATGVLRPGAIGMDLGAGYGGTARFLAQSFGVRVDCLNISDSQNARNRQMTEEAGLSDKVSVIYGSFQDIPAPDNSYDFLWSSDAIDHAPDKAKVFEEVARVLKPGGIFIFTDLMKADDVPASQLGPVLERIKLPDMGSVKLYRSLAAANGLKEYAVYEKPEALVNHYWRVKKELEKQKEEISKFCSISFQERMKEGLDHWVNAGKAGKLNWAMMLFQKP